MPAYAIASPSPIKKKSRCSRGSRDLVVPDNVDEEEDEDEELGACGGPGLGSAAPRVCVSPDAARSACLAQGR
jgi:hypothetical protein